MTPISAAGTYGAGEYYLSTNMTLAGNCLTFTGPASLDLNGKTITDTTGGNAWTHGVVTQGVGSIVYDSKGTGKITGFRVGVKAEASTKLLGIDLSANRYMGAWLAAANCAVIGGRIGSISGVTDEKYAIGVQCDSPNPLVEGVIFDEIYPQAGYIGEGAGEGLPVNFAANSSSGIMRRCICVNSEALLNTYGMFGGVGGGHAVEDNIFRNFWRAVASTDNGSVIIRRNFAWLHARLAGSQGFSCIEEAVSDNVAIGYDAPFSVGNLPKNVSIFLPAVAQTPVPTPTGVVLDTAIAGNFGNVDGKTIKVRINASQLSPPPGEVTKIRLTLQAHADEPLAIAKCYIGKKNAVGDTYDAVSLASLKVSGASAFTVPVGGQLVTDWLPFMWNKIDDLIVSFYCNGGASSDKLPAAVSSATGDTYLKNGDEAATANASGFTEYLGYLSLVTKIETDGFTGG